MQSSISESALQQLVSRLETAVTKLETKASGSNISANLMTTEKLAAFSDYWNKTLKLLIELQTAAKATGKDQIMAISEVAIEAICGHQDILIASESFKRPVKNDLVTLSKKFTAIVTKVADIGKANREFSLHSDAVKNGLDALYWVFAESSYADITQTYYESIDFAGNKILMQKVPEQSNWLKAYKAIINEVNSLVKANYRCGLTWSHAGDGEVTNLILTLGNTYRKNFKKGDSTVKDAEPDSREKIHEQISSGNVRKSLKAVTKIEPPKTETENNSNFKSKFKDVKRGRRVTLLKKGKKEVFEEGRNLFNYENIEDEVKELDESKLATRTVVQISNCSGCVFKVPNKVNSITLYNCEDCTIVAHSLISIFQITNSFKIKVQVEKSIHSFQVDGSSDVTLHLTLDCKDANVLACKSSEIRFRLPKEDDPTDYTEHSIPEQFVFKLNDKRKVDSRVSDLYDI